MAPLDLSELTHWGWVTQICISKFTIIVAYSAPSHYLNQWWNIVNSKLRNKFQWNLNPNSYVFKQENAFENVVWKMSAILSRPQCVKVWDDCPIKKFRYITEITYLIKCIKDNGFNPVWHNEIYSRKSTTDTIGYLTHWGLETLQVMAGHTNWFPLSRSMLTYCRLSIRVLRMKFSEICYQNTTIFYLEIAFEKVVCKMSAHRNHHNRNHGN